MNQPQDTLRGESVELVPLRAAEHADALFDATPADTFRWFLSRPKGWTRESFREWIGARAGADRSRMFVVVERASGRVVGSTSYLDIDDANRSVEIGSTWYTPPARGTRVNPECKLLLLRHAFEAMGRLRVTLKTDARNLRSQRAIAGVGAIREGTLRAHRVMDDGTARDTVYFSVTLADWARVRKLLEARLRAPEMPPSFAVRPAGESDVPSVLPHVEAICEMHRAMDPQRFTFRPNIVEMYAKWLPERAADPRSVFLVAHTPEGATVGYLVGTVEPEVPIYWTPESGWIHDLFVLPQWRKHGVAKALVSAAVERFTALGVERIRLETAAPNDGARAFFASCGFRPGTTEMLLMLRGDALVTDAGG